MKSPGIYQIRHEASGRVYVGSAVNVATRWRIHRGELKRGTHHCKALQQAWNRFGADAFSFTILETVPNEKELIAREQWWIDTLNAHFLHIGFNSAAIAGSVLGMRHSAETKARWSADRLGKPAPWNRRKHTAEQTAAHSAVMRGKSNGPHKPEAIAKMSAAKTGLKHSAETLEKMSLAWNKRREVGFSVETRAKLSKASKGNKRGLGHTHSEETRAQMSASHIAKCARDALQGKVRSKGNKNAAGFKHGAETRERMSQGQQLRWAKARLMKAAQTAQTRSSGSDQVVSSPARRRRAAPLQGELAFQPSGSQVPE